MACAMYLISNYAYAATDDLAKKFFNRGMPSREGMKDSIARSG